MSEITRFSIEVFNEKHKDEWNSFVDNSKNGTFLHKIDYMHYHLDRFNDCSLIIRDNDKIVALLPGIIENLTFYSHKGLTYGGLLLLPETKVEQVLLYFNLINRFLKNEKNIQKVVYKAIPFIYSKIPSQEDEYALFRLQSKIISSGLSSAIKMSCKIPFNSLRKRAVKKSKKQDLEIRKDYSFTDFWCVLHENLKKNHNTIPVHSLDEILLLKDRFRSNIALYSAYLEEECVAGIVMYITDTVAHVQYISANEIGKRTAALDFLFDYLINEEFQEKEYFDFGTSVENKGYYLNEGLIFQKQGFGARGILYQVYEYETNNIIINEKDDIL